MPDYSWKQSRSVVRRYRAKTYRRLLDIGPAYQSLLNRHDNVEYTLHPVLRVLADSGHHASMALLHRHFTLSKTEAMLHRTDGRLDIAKPVSLTALAHTKVLPILVKLELSLSGRYTIIPLEFAAVDDMAPEMVEQICAIVTDYKFIQQLGRELDQRRLLHLLGLSLGLGPTDETTVQLEANYENRTSITTTVERSAVHSDDVYPTQWSCSGLLTRGCLVMGYCQRVGSSHLHCSIHHKDTY